MKQNNSFTAQCIRVAVQNQWAFQSIPKNVVAPWRLIILQEVSKERFYPPAIFIGSRIDPNQIKKSKKLEEEEPHDKKAKCTLLLKGNIHLESQQNRSCINTMR